MKLQERGGACDWALAVAGDEIAKGGRQLGKARLWWGGAVLTVHVGTGHRFGDVPPMLFRTMVFHPLFGEIRVARYSQEGRAMKGHDMTVSSWSNPWFLVVLAVSDLLDFIRRKWIVLWE